MNKTSEITLEPYSPSSHFSLVLSWLKQRSLTPDKPIEVPKVGFIAYSGKEPTAAGFIRQCEGDYAFLDSFVTNPCASKQARNDSLNHLTYQLIEIAKENRIKRLFAYSSDESILNRSKEFGFKQLPATLVFCDLMIGNNC